jgi:hypothetical protein
MSSRLSARTNKTRLVKILWRYHGVETAKKQRNSIWYFVLIIATEKICTMSNINVKKVTSLYFRHVRSTLKDIGQTRKVSNYGVGNIGYWKALSVTNSRRRNSISVSLIPQTDTRHNHKSLQSAFHFHSLFLSYTKLTVPYQFRRFSASDTCECFYLKYMRRYFSVGRRTDGTDTELIRHWYVPDAFIALNFHPAAPPM